MWHTPSCVPAQLVPPLSPPHCCVVQLRRVRGVPPPASLVCERVFYVRVREGATTCRMLAGSGGLGCARVHVQIADAVASERHRIENARGALRDQASVLRDQRDIQRDFEARNEQLEQENQDLRDWVATFNGEHNLHDVVRVLRGGLCAFRASCAVDGLCVPVCAQPVPPRR
jgi:hypothetical protein